MQFVDMVLSQAFHLCVEPARFPRSSKTCLTLKQPSDNESFTTITECAKSDVGNGNVQTIGVKGEYYNTKTSVALNIHKNATASPI